MADLIVMKFDNTQGGLRALSAVQALEELRYAWIDDVAVVEKHKPGFVTIHSPHGSPGAGAWFGGLLGLLLFWWFPPAWFFGGWLAGLGIGALVGDAMAKAGLDKNMIDEIKSELARRVGRLGAGQPRSHRAAGSRRHVARCRGGTRGVTQARPPSD